MSERPKKKGSRTSSGHRRNEVKATYSLSKTSKFYKSDSALETLVGKTYKDRYKILELLASEDISASFKAEDTREGKMVVLRAPRFFQPDIIKSFTGDTSKLKALTNMDGTYSIQLLDEFVPFCVEEYIPTEQRLDKLMNCGQKFSTVEALDITIDVCQSISRAHKLSLLHGRVRPSNIYILYVGDKKVARLGGYCLAQAQVILGKHKVVSKQSPYLSASIFHNHRTEAHDDIYSLAVLGYYLLSGKLPVIASLQSISSNQYESLSSSCPEVEDSAFLNRIFKKALRVGGQEPYGNAIQFLADLNRIKNALKDSKKELKNNPVTISERTEEVDASPAASREESDQKAEKSAETLDPMTSDLIEEKLQDLLQARKEDLDLESEIEPSLTIETSRAESEETSDLPSAEVVEHPVIETEEEDSVQNGDDEVLDDVIKADDKVGKIILDRYVLLELRAKNSLTAVYLAKDLSQDRMVAVKTLVHPQPNAVLEFAREVERMKSLAHENLPAFIDYQESEGSPYYVMEFIDAPTLEELLEQIQSVETEEQIASAAIQICDVLDYLHENGVYHGNISASSVMFLEQDGQVLIKLCGLGTNTLKEMLDEQGNYQSGMFANSSMASSLSMSNKLDIYSTTALIYQMTTGKLPYETASSNSLSEDEKQVESVSFLRPDMFGVDKLDKSLKRILNTTSDTINSSFKDLRSNIKNWIDTAYDELDLSVPDELDDQGVDKAEWLSSKEAKSLEELQEEMRKNMHLKTNQVKVEKTLAMQFTNKISLAGRRKSPVRTIAEIVFLVTAGGLTIFFLADYGINHKDELRSNYFRIARDFSTSVSGGRDEEKGVDLSGEEIAFDYKQDLAYKRWTDAKIVGEPRRIMPDGNLKSK